MMSNTLNQEFRLHSEWWFYCSNCDHKLRLSPDALIAQFGADYKMALLRTRARCSKCGGRGRIKVSSGPMYGTSRCFEKNYGAARSGNGSTAVLWTPVMRQAST